MKFFVVVSALLVVVRAGVIAPIALPTIAASSIVAVPVGQHSSQYHSQDAIGQYSYGYANELSAKNEIKLADGQTVGAYSYLDGEGKIQNVQYRSDALSGFRVAATNLPIAPALPETAPLVQPEPVKDTPEVVEARTRHLEAFRQAEDEVKKLQESLTVELKSAIPAQPTLVSPPAPAAVVRSAPTVELIRSAPLLTAPSFGYSFGINYGGLFAVNTYSLQPQALVTAYAAPGHLIAAPILADAVPIATEGVAQPAPESPSDLPEVVEARAKESAEEKDVDKEQKLAKE